MGDAHGGEGDDTLSAEGTTLLEGEFGDDFLRGGSGMDTLPGGEVRTSAMAGGGRWSRPPPVRRSSEYPDRIHVVTSLGFGRKPGQATKGNR